MGDSLFWQRATLSFYCSITFIVFFLYFVANNKVISISVSDVTKIFAPNTRNTPNENHITFTIRKQVS